MINSQPYFIVETEIVQINPRIKEKGLSTPTVVKRNYSNDSVRLGAARVIANTFSSFMRLAVLSQAQSQHQAKRHA